LRKETVAPGPRVAGLRNGSLSNRNHNPQKRREQLLDLGRRKE